MQQGHDAGEENHAAAQHDTEQGEYRASKQEQGAGVMCNQSAQHGVGVPGVAQVAGAVERVQARGGEAGRVADVVQRSGFQETGVRAENRGQAIDDRVG